MGWILILLVVLIGLAALTVPGWASAKRVPVATQPAMVCTQPAASEIPAAVR